MPGHSHRHRREREEFLRRHLNPETGGEIIGPTLGPNRIVGIVDGGAIMRSTMSDVMPSMRGGDLLNQISFREPVSKKERQNIRFVF